MTSVKARPSKKSSSTPTTVTQSLQKNDDDFMSVARRLGADEDKTRFEEKLGRIAKPNAKTHAAADRTKP